MRGRAIVTAKKKSKLFLKGFNYFSFWEGNYSGTWAGGSPDTILRMAAIGCNSVSIVPTWFTDTATSTNIHVSNNQNSEPDTGVTIASNQCRNAGLKVIIKPHIDCEDGTYRGFFVPSNWDTWFTNYQAHILRYANIAQNTGAWGLCIGCELAGTTKVAQRSYWVSLINAVRNVYSGKIIYAADWDEFRFVGFWDLVDIIGTDAYIPLTDGTTLSPTLTTMINGWNSVPVYPDYAHNSTGDLSPVAYYRSIAQQYGKPILFTELGYRNDAAAVRDPGIWSSGTARDDACQARAYDAYFHVWPKIGSWFIGAQFWNYMIADNWANIGTGTNVGNIDFTPQNRQAETLVSNYFTGVTPLP